MSKSSSFRRLEPIHVADALLGLFVVLVLGLLIVPLPPWLLDLCLSANLALSITVVFATLYVSRTLDFAVFPSLLLLTTLLRLGLNVASTRLILLDGYAGEVIASFGAVVVRGNYAVGAVVFFVLCVIQYVVIAKGSERIAEVGARFALEAMPGKQMTIDAELRSGSIDARGARERRRALEQESQFYGAMDGAMKFVKGDVIAGFLITLTNLLGGFALGTLQRDLSPIEALKTYGLLAVGDGLVAQIPSIVLAVGAGILVTRVSGDVEQRSLARDVVGQLSRLPSALAKAGAFVALLGLVPGLPTIPFLVTGGLLLSASVLQRRRRRAPDMPRPSARQRPVSRLLPLRLRVGKGSLLRSARDPELLSRQEAPALFELFETLERRVFLASGVNLPPCRFEYDSQLGDYEVKLEVREKLVFSYDGSSEDASPLDGLGTALQPVLLRHAGSFLGLTETQALLDALEEIDPVTVRQVVPKIVSLTLLHDLLGRLVGEAVSIRDLSGILVGLTRIAGSEKSPHRLAELLRLEIRPILCHSLVSDEGLVHAIMLDPTLEDMIRMGISLGESEPTVALAPTCLRDIIATVSRTFQEAKQTASGALVLLTSPDIRRPTRKLIELALPDLPVLAFNELLPELTLQTVGVVGLTGVGSDD